jgi:alpha-glucosidase (family GH31 glycosyl hydrolase)
VGAFYPFSRNHRVTGAEPQEPWRFNTTQFDANHTYADLMRDSIQRKYSLIRYYYTHMTQMSLANNTFYTLYKPLFFAFPDEAGAYKDIVNNVMIGPSIKTSVNARSVTQNMTDFYFPPGTWCSLFAPVGDCIYNAIG